METSNLYPLPLIKDDLCLHWNLDVQGWKIVGFYTSLYPLVFSFKCTILTLMASTSYDSNYTRILSLSIYFCQASGSIYLAILSLHTCIFLIWIFIVIIKDFCVGLLCCFNVICFVLCEYYSMTASALILWIFIYCITWYVEFSRQYFFLVESVMIAYFVSRDCDI